MNRLWSKKRKPRPTTPVRTGSDLRVETLEERWVFADVFWSGAVNGDWNDTGNWVGGMLPTSADTLVFDAAGANRVMFNDLASDFQALRFEDTGYEINIGFALNLSATGTAISVTAGGPTVLNVPISFAPGATVDAGPGFLDVFADFTIASGSTLTFISDPGGVINMDAPIHGVGSGVNIQGGGRVFYLDDNTYTGLTDVSASGWLVLDAIGVQSVDGDLNVSGGGLVQWLQSNQVSDTADINVNLGSLDLLGASEQIDDLTLNGNLSTGNLTVDELIVTGGQVQVFSGGVLTANIASISDVSLFEAYQNATVNINGDLTLSNSVLRLYRSAAGPATVLNLNGDIFLLGTTSSSIIPDGIGAVAPAINLNGSRTFDVADTPVPIDFNIDVAMFNGSVVKTGLGRMQANGVQDYLGTTAINAGVLEFNGTLASAGTPAGLVTIAGGATLAGTGNLFAAISGALGSTIDATSGISLGDGASITGFSTLGDINVGAATLTLRDLDGADLGATTTLAGGAINASSGVVLSSGDVLTGSGAINGFTTALGDSQLLPGGAGIGQFTFNGPLTLAPGAVYEVALQGPGPGVGYDQIVYTDAANLDLNGSTLLTSRLATFVPLAGASFTIIDNQNAASDTIGTFAGIADLSTINLGGMVFQINYNGGTGNDVTLTVVAPPVVYVDDDFASLTLGDDPPGPALVFGYDAFATIQGGVNQVAVAGSVVVAAGTYAENVTIAKNLTLSGAGAATIVDPAAGDAFTLTAAATAVNLSSFRVTGAANGIVADGQATLGLLNLGIDNNSGAGLVLSNAGAIVLANVTLAANGSGGSITTATAVNVTGQTGAVDQTFNANGTQFSVDAGQAVSHTGVGTLNLFGDDGNDTFNISPATNAAGTQIFIDGGNPAVPVGDTLNLDLAGVTSPSINFTGPGSGNVTSPSHAMVTWTNIETPDINNVGDVIITGTGLDDVLVVTSTAAGSITYVLNGAPAVTLDGVTSFTWNALAGNDEMIVDFTNTQNPIPLGGIIYDGGANTTLDRLTFVPAAAVASVDYDLLGAGAADITIDDGAITRTVSVVGVERSDDPFIAATRSFNYSAAADVITLADSGAPADSVMSIDAATGLFVNFRVPTTTLDINAGDGADAIQVTGADANLTAALNLDGEANADTIALSAALAGLASLSALADGITLGADISTVGSQSYTGAVSLSGNRTLTAGTNVSFNGTITGGGANLSVSAVLDTLFAGNVAGVGTLQTTGGGTTTIDTASVQANVVDFDDAVIIAQSTTVTGTTSIDFASTVNSAAAETNDLTLNSPLTAFHGVVGGSQALGTLSTDAAGTTTIDTTAVNANIVDFNDAVVIAVSTTISGATSVDFAGAVDSQTGETNNLAITSPVTAFHGVVGVTQSLGTLSTDAAGTTTIDTTNIVAVNVDFNDAVLLNANTTITGTTSVDFGSTVDSQGVARDLTVNSPTTAFHGIVGGTLALASLTTDAAGTTTIDTTSITSAVIDLNDAVVIDVDTTLIAATSIDFASTVNSTAAEFNDLVLNSPLTAFHGVVGGANALGLLQTDAAGTTTIDTTAVTATTVDFNDAVVIDQSATITVTTSVDFAATLDSAVGESNNLAINSPLTAFHGDVGATGIFGTLSTDAAGTTTIDTAAVNAAIVDFNDAVLITQTVTVTGTTSIDFASTVDSATAVPQDLILNSPVTAFHGNVGATNALDLLSTDAAGTTTIDAAIVTAATVDFNDAIVVATSTMLTGTTSVDFAQTVDSQTGEANNLVINSPSTTFNGTVGGTQALGTLSTDAAGTTFVLTTSVTAAIVDFNDAVRLAANVTINGTTSVDFAGTVDGNGVASNLVVNSPTTGFHGLVGNAVALGSLTTDAVGTTTFDTTSVIAAIVDLNDAIVIDQDLTIDAATSIDFASSVNSTAAEFNDLVLNSPLTAFHGIVGGANALGLLQTDAAGTTTIDTTAVTATTVDFDDAVVIDQSATITGTTSVDFAATLDSAVGENNNLAINSPLTAFHGDVGATGIFGTLSTDAAGTTTIDTAAVNAAIVDFNDAVLITQTVTVTGTSSIDFASTVDSATAVAQDLILNSPVTAFHGNVGATNALDLLSTDAAGTTTIDAAIVTAATVDFNDAIVVATSTTLTGTTSVDFAQTVDSQTGEANDLVINSPSTTFNGIVGGTQALGTLSTDAAGTTFVLTTSVTAAIVDFNDAVRLAANVMINGTTSVDFAGTVDGNGVASNLVVNSPTTGFHGLVGNAVALGSLTTDAAGTTTFDTTSVIAAVVDLNDAVVIDQDLSIDAATSIDFAGTIDSQTGEANDLILNSPLTALHGIVGGVEALDLLQTDAAGTTTIDTSAITAAVVDFNDAIVIAAPVTTITGTTSVDFASTLDGQTGETNDLFIISPDTQFHGAVGGIQPLGTLSTDAGGTTTIDTPTIIAGNVLFGDAVLLNQDTTIIGTISVDFGSTIDSVGAARDLTVNSPTTAFHGIVGGTLALDVLTTDAAGTTTIDTTAITAAVLDFNDAIVVDQDATLIGTTSIDFASTVNSTAAEFNDLVLNSPLTAFHGIVGGANALGLLQTDAAGTTTIDTTAVTATTVDFNDAIVIDQSTTITGLASVDFASTVDSASGETNNLAVNSPLTAFHGIVGGNEPFGTLSTDAAGTTTIDTTAVFAGVVSLADAVLLNQDVTITGTTSIDFGSTVDSATAVPQDLILVSPATAFHGNVGATSALDLLQTDAAGTTTIDAAIVTAATVDFNDAIIVATSNTLTGTTSVDFASTVNSQTGEANDFVINSPDTTFHGVVGGVQPLGILSTDAAGTTTIDTNSISAAIVDFNDAIVLNTNTTVNGTTSVDFAQTVDGNGVPVSLLVNSPITGFHGVVGGGTALSSLTTDAAGVTTFDTTSVTAAIIDLNDAVLIDQNATFIAATSIDFAGTLNSATGETNDLVLNSPLTAFHGVVGGTQALGLLQTDAAGTTTVDTTAVTAAIVDFNDAIVIDTSSTITGSTSVDFAQTVNSAAGETNNLVVNSPVTGFHGLVGTTQALGTLSTDAAGVTTIDTTAVVAFNLDFNDSLRLDQSATLTGFTTADFASAIDSAVGETNSLTVNSPNTAFHGIVGGADPLAALVTDAVGTTFVDTTAITAAIIDFNDAIQVDTSSTLNGATSVDFASTVNSAAGEFNNLVVNSPVTGFHGQVGVVSSLGILQTDAAGTTTIDTTAVVAIILDWNDAIVLDQSATLTGSASIDFASTVNGQTGEANNLILNSPATAFHGIVGGLQALGLLATDAAGTTFVDTTAITAVTLDFNDVIQVDQSSTLTGLGSIDFATTIDSQPAELNNLILNSPVTVFHGAVGGTQALGLLQTDAAGTTTIDAPSITAIAVNLLDAVRLSDDVTVVGASSIDFGGTVDGQGGGRDLLLASADTAFHGFVGSLQALSTLTVVAGGTTTFDIAGSSSAAPSVRTSGDQTYNNAVLLQQGTVLASNNGDLTFSGTIDSLASAQSLTLNSDGDNVLSGPIGAANALASFTTDDPTSGTSGGELIFDFGGASLATPSVRTTGFQTYNESVDLAVDPVLVAGGQIRFEDSLDIRNQTLTTVAATNGTFLGDLTTIEGGTISAARGVVVRDGDSLIGNGTIITNPANSGAVFRVDNGGTLSPGFGTLTPSAAGLLNVQGNLQLASGAELVVQLNGVAPNQYDRILLAGGGNVNGAILNAALNFLPEFGDNFTIFQVAAGGGVGGSFFGLPDGSQFQLVLTGSTLPVGVQISYTGGDGNDVELLINELVLTPFTDIAGADIPVFFVPTATQLIPVPLEFAPALTVEDARRGNAQNLSKLQVMLTIEELSGFSDPQVIRSVLENLVLPLNQLEDGLKVLADQPWGVYRVTIQFLDGSKEQPLVFELEINAHNQKRSIRSIADLWRSLEYSQQRQAESESEQRRLKPILLDAADATERNYLDEIFDAFPRIAERMGDWGAQWLPPSLSRWLAVGGLFDASRAGTDGDAAAKVEAANGPKWIAPAQLADPETLDAADASAGAATVEQLDDPDGITADDVAAGWLTAGAFAASFASAEGVDRRRERSQRKG